METVLDFGFQIQLRVMLLDIGVPSPDLIKAGTIAAGNGVHDLGDEAVDRDLIDRGRLNSYNVRLEKISTPAFHTSR